MTAVPGFGDSVAENDDNDQPDTVKRKIAKKGGGFQCMGFNYDILKGIMKRGYKIPTPIQRKAIPLALEGRDIVAMARTGSGKTACFLLPLFNRLKARSGKAGARALILSPTRELAIQTLKFTKELGRFTDLKAAVVLGGDAMEYQFAAIHGNPDIIIATPGRFVHVCIEMDLKLTAIEYVVFDEADRLFEMGFGEQLSEIVARLPDCRQTLLFSATLPKLLVDFAKAGLSDPVLIRLDVESKLPTGLDLQFVVVRPDERVAAILLLLQVFIEREQQTVVFAPTKHHVEYIHLILELCGIENTFIYSDLDPSARKINTAKFGQGKVKVLVVTDVAARGLDIPQLDNVINYNFPAKPKLFVHRVGRCARAGRTGIAYSLVTPDEYAYLLDLHLFLGQTLKLVTVDERDGNVGRLPQNLIEEQHSSLMLLHERRMDLLNVQRVSENAYKNYIRCRELSSPDSCRRVKEIAFHNCSTLPIYKAFNDSEESRDTFLRQMSNYRPQDTIFELKASNKGKADDGQVMKTKRSLNKGRIQAFHQKTETRNVARNENEKKNNLVESQDEDIKSTFQEIVTEKKRNIEDLYKKEMKKRKIKDEEHYVPYSAPDNHTEQGLAVHNFAREADKAQFNLTNTANDSKPTKTYKKWDRTKKKMVVVNEAKNKKIKTESGVWISASFKGNKYTEWKEKMKVVDAADNSDDETVRKPNNSFPHTHWAKHNEKVKMKQRNNEMKSKEQILKMRKLKAKKKRKNNKKSPNKQKKKYNGRRK